MSAADTRQTKKKRPVLQDKDTDTENTKMANKNNLPRTGGKGGNKKLASAAMISVKTVEYKALKEKSAMFAKMEKDLAKHRSNNNKLEDENEAKMTEVADLQANLAIKEKEMEELTKKLAEYSSALSKTGGKAESELNAALITNVKSCTKHQLFRTHKFLVDDTDLIAGMHALVGYLPNKLVISTEEFCRDYKNIVRVALNEARGYVQSQGAKKVNGTYSILHIACVVSAELWTLCAESVLANSQNIWFSPHFWVLFYRMVA